MQTTVRQLMSPTPVTIPHTATIDEALEVLLRRQVGEIYLIDENDQLIGVVPDYELLKARMARMPGYQCVEMLASRNLACTHPDTDAALLAVRFRCGHCRRMAVVDGGRIVGQISRRDILELMVASTEIAEPEIDTDAMPESADSTIPASFRSPSFMRTQRSEIKPTVRD